MNETPQAATVAALVPAARAPRQATGHGAAPANLALIKYWGKRDEQLNLPLTDSLSLALAPLGTTTALSLAPGPRDEVVLGGQPLAPETSFARRVTAFLDLFRPPGQGYRVTTENTVPTAAGLASSASGYAALTLALDDLYGWQLPRRSLSVLARLGSGSACRSLYDGFVWWHAGSRADGLDSYAEPVVEPWPALRLGVLPLVETAKPIGSRDAMRATREQSPLFAPWPALCRANLAALRPALAARDFATFGQLAEHNALCMHATMLGTWPPLLYWRPETVAALHRLWELRHGGCAVYGTLDAGPNLKLLFLRQDESTLRQAFPQLIILAPFGA
jgi:diphosphomevalonate decarboxylase